MINFIKFFEKSNSPNTYLWIADILLLMTKKYSPLEIMQDTEMGKPIH